MNSTIIHQHYLIHVQNTTPNILLNKQVYTNYLQKKRKRKRRKKRKEEQEERRRKEWQEKGREKERKGMKRKTKGHGSILFLKNIKFIFDKTTV